MIEHLSAETSKSVLDYFLQTGRITAEEVRLGLAINTTPEMRRVVDFIHTMFCQLTHNPQAPPSQPYCCYHEEEQQLDSCWKADEHRHWVRRTLAIMDSLNIGSEESFHKVFQQTQRILNLVSELKEREPAAVQLAWLLLDLEQMEAEDEED